jgi:hypothetical protein
VVFENKFRDEKNNIDDQQVFYNCWYFGRMHGPALKHSLPAIA